LALLSPVAWSIAFGIWVGLSLHVCSERTKPVVLVVALVTALATVLAIIAGLAVYRRSPHNGETRVERFMDGLALGGGLLFALVVALSAVPVFLLSSCPS
jgi:hypothetical protein